MYTEHSVCADKIMSSGQLWTFPLFFHWLHHLGIYNNSCLTKFRQELDVRSGWVQRCSHAAAKFTKLYIKRFLDNLIPLGDMVRPFLCQFSPSLLFKPPLSSCSPTMQNRAFFPFSYLFSVWLPPPKPLRQHAVYANDRSFMLKVEWDLNKISLSLSLTHTHTRTHRHGDSVWKCTQASSLPSFFFNFRLRFVIWNPLLDYTR